MGINISGIAINKSYRDNIDQLQSDFNWVFSKESETDFETASKNWTKKGVCYVYFTDSGTLMFLEKDMCSYPYSIEGSNCLTFVHSETSMAFKFDYNEGKILRRSIMEVKGKNLDNYGNSLSVEEISTDTSEIIFAQISQVLGKEFFSIEPDERAFKLTFATEKDATEIYNKISKLITTKVVANGLDSLEELKTLYGLYLKMGGKLSPVESKATFFKNEYKNRQVKEFIYVLSKDWERVDKKEKNPILSNIMITTTAIMWHLKKIDISDIRDGSFVYKKWWQFRKNGLKALKELYPQ